MLRLPPRLILGLVLLTLASCEGVPPGVAPPAAADTVEVYPDLPFGHPEGDSLAGRYLWSSGAGPLHTSLLWDAKLAVRPNTHWATARDTLAALTRRASAAHPAVPPHLFTQIEAVTLMEKTDLLGVAATDAAARAELAARVESLAQNNSPQAVLVRDALAVLGETWAASKRAEVAGIVGRAAHAMYAQKARCAECDERIGTHRPEIMAGIERFERRMRVAADTLLAWSRTEGTGAAALR